MGKNIHSYIHVNYSYPYLNFDCCMCLCIVHLVSYRRIAGDNCTISGTKNDYFLPEQRPCPVAGKATEYVIVAMV